MMFSRSERRRLRVAEAALQEIDRRLTANNRSSGGNDAETLDHVYVAIGAWRRGIEAKEYANCSHCQVITPHFDI
jgi:hypothetical protein